ncbi:hypothetical protein D3C78_1713330 [compost metagenome]
MTQGNRTAVEVDLIVHAFQQPQIFNAGQRLGGKGLIQFKQIDILHAQTGAFKREFAGRHRTIAHDRRIASHDRH